MEKEFIPYQQSVDMKELGFDEPCLGLYHNDMIFCPTQCKSHEEYHGQVCSAPLYQQAFKFFREKYSITSSVRTHFNKEFFYEIYVDVMNEITSNYYKTYEESELECIKKLIEICKNK